MGFFARPECPSTNDVRKQGKRPSSHEYPCGKFCPINFGLAGRPVSYFEFSSNTSWSGNCGSLYFFRIHVRNPSFQTSFPFNNLRQGIVHRDINLTQYRQSFTTTSWFDKEETIWVRKLPTSYAFLHGRTTRHRLLSGACAAAHTARCRRIHRS